MNDVQPSRDPGAGNLGRVGARRCWWVRADLIGTAVFVVARDRRARATTSRQILVGAVSLVLFAAGAAGSLWAYVSALERSRVRGGRRRQPLPAHRRHGAAAGEAAMSLALAVQVVVASPVPSSVPPV
jgi:hypothetical protein